MTYDVVVAGASFAGLAVAQAVRGRLLVVDPQPLGEGQTSACGAPLSVVERAGAAGAVQQVHRSLVVHTPRRAFVWDLQGEPFCTFDYRRFCELAWQRVQGELVQAAAWSFDGFFVHTSSGRFRAELAVDCTGWRAVLARSFGGPSVAGPRWKWFGLETEVPTAFEPGLHFYFWPEVAPDGYAWAFPCGDRVRFGVLSYRGRTRLRSQLEAFLARFHLQPRGYHGGFLGVGPACPGAGRLFAVGDSAGHCLPLTGEGIRCALHAGWLVGSLASGVLAGHFTLEAAHRRYGEYLRAQRGRVAFLSAAAECAVRWPPALRELALAAWSHPVLRRTFLRHYLGTFPAADAVD